MAFQSKILCFVTFRVQDPWATGGTNYYYYYYYCYNIIIIFIIIICVLKLFFTSYPTYEPCLVCYLNNNLLCCFITFLCVSMWLNVNMNANVNKWKFNNILRPQIPLLGVVYIVLFACYISSQESEWCRHNRAIGIGDSMAATAMAVPVFESHTKFRVCSSQIGNTSTCLCMV